MLKLSICIPTYNRGKFLPTLFESIINQGEIYKELEVVVSDNSSTDNTNEVIEKYSKIFPNFVHHRFESNQGADANFLKVVDLASAEFCWLMGSDDLLMPNSVQMICDTIRDRDKIAGISLNVRGYNYAGDKQIWTRPVDRGVLSKDVYLENAENIFSLLGYYFGFISSNVVRRSLWQDVIKAYPVREYFNAYVHVYVMARMLQAQPYWYFIQKPCVGWRSGNDSFLTEGTFRRMSLDVVGYEKIARDVFGADSPAYRELNKTVSTVHVRYAVMGAKLNNSPICFYTRAAKLLVRYYWSYPQFWLMTFPMLLVPSFLVRLARFVYRRTLKNQRIQPLSR